MAKRFAKRSSLREHKFRTEKGNPWRSGRRRAHPNKKGREPSNRFTRKWGPSQKSSDCTNRGRDSINTMGYLSSISIFLEKKKKACRGEGPGLSLLEGTRHQRERDRKEKGIGPVARYGAANAKCRGYKSFAPAPTFVGKRERGSRAKEGVAGERMPAATENKTVARSSTVRGDYAQKNTGGHLSHNKEEGHPLWRRKVHLRPILKRRKSSGK